MRISKWLGIVGLALVACSAPAQDGAKGTTSSVTQKAFDKNDLLDDKALADANALDADGIQKFLEKTPWGTTSVLATYTEDGQTAAEILDGAAKKYGINPIALLVRAQMEQGLVSKKTANASSIDIAMGCACPETSACSHKYEGFANQAECAAGTLSRSLTRAASSTGTVSGWARYKKKTTEDGVAITPKNAATAALYTYTPWVGEAGGGQKGVGGASLHYQVWSRFAEALSYAPSAGNTDDDTTTPIGTSTSDASAPDASDPIDTDASDPIDPPPDPSMDDAGSPPPPSTTDAGTGTGSSTKDAGTTKDSGTSAAAAPPEDGSEDGDLLQGNQQPASNAPPPKGKSGSSSSSGSGSEEEATASDLDKGGKSQSSGCSTTGSGSQGSGDALLVAAAALASVIGARRRRST